MSKASKLFIITLIVCAFSALTKAQTGTIQLNVMDISTVDFAAFAFEKNLTNQPRILQVIIQTEPQNAKVYVTGSIKWKKNESSDYAELVNFTTDPFTARNFSNDEIGTTEIKLTPNTTYNSDLLKENLDMGKPTGSYEIYLILHDESGKQLDDDVQHLEFLNPTPPTVLLPAEGSSNDVGSILVQWTPSIGASSYKVKANYLNEGQSKEEALNSSDPLINNVDVGTFTSVNMRDILSKELLNDRQIVLVVKAIVPGPGSELELQSPIVTFRTNSQQNAGGNQSGVQSDPTLIQLADFLKSRGLDQNFINQIMSGEIAPGDIQLTDENNNQLQFTDLQNLLIYLAGNSQAIINVNFTAK